MPESSMQVFLSYARANSDAADRVEKQLVVAGFEVWRDIRHIKNTDIWAQAVGQGLKSSERLVVLMSPASMNSREVFMEWFYFYHHRKPLHCLLIETCSINYHLLPFNYVDAREDMDSALRQLVSALNKPFTMPDIKEIAEDHPVEDAEKQRLYDLSLDPDSLERFYK